MNYNKMKKAELIELIEEQDDVIEKLQTANLDTSNTRYLVVAIIVAIAQLAYIIANNL